MKASSGCFWNADILMILEVKVFGYDKAGLQSHVILFTPREERLERKIAAWLQTA